MVDQQSGLRLQTETMWQTRSFLRSRHYTRAWGLSNTAVPVYMALPFTTVNQSGWIYIRIRRRSKKQGWQVMGLFQVDRYICLPNSTHVSCLVLCPLLVTFIYSRADKNIADKAPATTSTRLSFIPGKLRSKTLGFNAQLVHVY